MVFVFQHMKINRFCEADSDQIFVPAHPSSAEVHLNTTHMKIAVGLDCPLL